MRRIIVVLSALALVASCGSAFSQGSMVSSATDGFAVPSALTTGEGTVTVGVYSVTKGDDKTGTSLTVGVTDRIDMFANGVVGGLVHTDHNRLGAKWRFTPKVIGDRGVQLSAFCFDVRSGVTPKPGMSATWTGPRGLTLTAAGWHQDGSITGGASALYPVSREVSLYAEYSENDGLATGVMAASGHVNGLVYWLDRYDDVFVSANYVVAAW